MPTWIRGKRPEEAANLINQMYQNLTQQSGLPQNLLPQQGYQPGYAAPPQPAPAPAPVELDWINEPDKATGYVVDQRIQSAQQQVNTQLQTIAQQNAETAKWHARQIYANEWSRWGPEIEMLLNGPGVTPEQVTPTFIENAVTLVRGRHAQEIQKEQLDARVQEVLNQQQGADPLRTGGFATGTGENTSNVLDLKDESIPFETRIRFEQNQISQPQVDEFLQKMGWIKQHGSLDAARAAYLKLLKTNNAISSPVND